MKLELESVAFKNFLSFGSRVQEVDFLRGTNLVTGLDVERNRSNGSGKSSFLETLPFAMFGQVHRKIKKDQIINWKNRKNCEVIHHFRKDGIPYSILRAIKPNKLELYRDGHLIDRPAHVKDYQKIIDEVLGFNYQTFMSVIHSNINSSAKILSMSKPDKRKFMETMFGLTLYTRLNEKCNSKLKSIKDNINEISFANSANQSIIDDTQQRILDIHEQVKKLHLPQIELKEAQENLKEMESDLPNTSEDLEHWKRIQKEEEADIEYNLHLIERIQNGPQLRLGTKIKTIRKSMTDLEPKIESMNDYKFLVNKNGTIDQITDDIERLNESAMKLHDEISKIDTETSIIKEKLRTANIEIESIGKKIRILSQDECPECGQKIESEDMLILKKQELEMTNNDITNMNAKFSEKTQKSIKLNKKRYEILSKITMLSNCRSTMSTRLEESNGVSLDDYEKWKKDIIRYKKAFKKLMELKTKLIKENGEWQRGLQDTGYRIEDLQHNVDKIIQLQNNMRQLEIKAEAVESTLKQHHESIHKEEMKTRKLMDDMDKSSRKQVRLTEIKDYLEYTKFLCKDENIKQEAISNVMPYMTKKTNTYLSDVDYGFYAVFDKWLDAEIKGPGITNASYGSLSGGEGRGIDIALQLAFLDIAKVRAGVFPDFLTFDELLDSSIDGVGITQLFKIIKSKQKDDNSKLFIISHRTELDNMDDVDNVYEVIKDGGYSRVEIKN